MAITRLTPDGYGGRRTGSFADKREGTGGGAGGEHPVAILTRLALGGYGAQRAGNFADKSIGSVVGGNHPVAILTRLALGGYGAQRAGSFAGKNTTEEQPPQTSPAVPIATYGGGAMVFHDKKRQRHDSMLLLLS